MTMVDGPEDKYHGREEHFYTGDLDFKFPNGDFLKVNGSPLIPAGVPATTAEAIAGVDNSKVITPATAAQIIPFKILAPNGVDDTAALNAALLAQQTAGGGKVIALRGVWNISGPVLVPDSVDLVGVASGWAKSKGSSRPQTIFVAIAAGASIIFEGGGACSGHFNIDGDLIATSPMLHRRGVAAMRFFESIGLYKSKTEAWRIDESQNDVWINIHMIEHDGIGLIMDKGSGGHVFLGCEFAGCATWPMVITETTGTGPYTIGPSDNTFDHCLFEHTRTGLTSIDGCVWIKTGKRTVFRSCSFNPGTATTINQALILIDGTGIGSDPIVIFDSCWLASGAGPVDHTGIWQKAGTVIMYGVNEFGNLYGAWRFDAGIIRIYSETTYSAVTNRWHPLSAGEWRNAIARFSRPIQTAVETNDFFAYRVTQIGDTGARLDIGVNGALNFGSGTGATDTIIQRASANIAAMGSGDSFSVQGGWNTGRLLMGSYHFWVDASGRLRIKNGTPVSDTDGTVVGTQT